MYCRCRGPIHICSMCPHKHCAVVYKKNTVNKYAGTLTKTRYHAAKWYVPYWSQCNRSISTVQPPSKCLWSSAGEGFVASLATSGGARLTATVTSTFQLPARGFLLVFCSNHKVHHCWAGLEVKCGITNLQRKRGSNGVWIIQRN